MQSLRTVCAESSAWSAYTLPHKTPSHYLDELITTTVSSFIRSRGSTLNVYRRRHFATPVDRQQSSAQVPRIWNSFFPSVALGSVSYCEWEAAFALQENEIKLE